MRRRTFVKVAANRGVQQSRRLLAVAPATTATTGEGLRREGAGFPPERGGGGKGAGVVSTAAASDGLRCERAVHRFHLEVREGRGGEGRYRGGCAWGGS